MNIENIPVRDIKPYEKNAKKHPAEQVEHIANSIKEFGFKQPLVVDANNVLVIGHGRLLAAKKLGMDTVPCVRADDLTPEQIKALRLADNKTNESDWDAELLNIELDDITDIDMGLFGFEMKDDEPVEIVEDDIPETAETRCKLGDIWQLGDHRLMCGDSTDAESVGRLMDGAKADLLLTDPPYNCDVGSCERPHSSNNGVHILNDRMEEQTFIEFLSKALNNASENMRGGAAYYIWYAGLHHIEFESALRTVQEFKLHEQLVWVKSHFVLGRNSDYQWMHELCLYGWKTGEAHYFSDSRAEATVIEDKAVKLSTLKKDELIALCEKLMGIKQSTTILRAEKPNAADLHPTIKPQNLICELVKNSSINGWNVLDLFGGSGSTLIACEQLNRRCYMMELDPHYCDVIIQRWENFTGRKAELINGEAR